MNKWFKIFIGLAFFSILVLGLGYKFLYNKPHKNFEKAHPDYQLTSEKLFFDFQNNKDEAGQKFNGSVIEIKGYLSKIETPESMTIAVFAISAGMFGDEGIRATMLSNYSEMVKSYIGKEIKLKGYCAGYNDTDVILEKCSIVK